MRKAFAKQRLNMSKHGITKGSQIGEPFAMEG